MTLRELLEEAGIDGNDSIATMLAMKYPTILDKPIVVLYNGRRDILSVESKSDENESIEEEELLSRHERKQRMAEDAYERERDER